MTYEGAMQKIGILLGLVVISALFTSAFSLSALENGNGGLLIMLSLGGMIVGFILAMIIYMTRPKNPAPLMMTYAVVEGVFIGLVGFVGLVGFGGDGLVGFGFRFGGGGRGF